MRGGCGFSTQPTCVGCLLFRPVASTRVHTRAGILRSLPGPSLGWLLAGLRRCLCTCLASSPQAGGGVSPSVSGGLPICGGQFILRPGRTFIPPSPGCKCGSASQSYCGETGRARTRTQKGGGRADLCARRSRGLLLGLAQHVLPPFLFPLSSSLSPSLCPCSLFPACMLPLVSGFVCVLCIRLPTSWESI